MQIIRIRLVLKLLPSEIIIDISGVLGTIDFMEAISLFRGLLFSLLSGRLVGRGGNISGGGGGGGSRGGGDGDGRVGSHRREVALGAVHGEISLGVGVGHHHHVRREDVLVGDRAFVFVVRKVQKRAQRLIHRTLVREIRERIFFERFRFKPTHHTSHRIGRTKRESRRGVVHRNIRLRGGEGGGRGEGKC